MISVPSSTNSPFLMTTMRRVTDRWLVRRRKPAFLFAGAVPLMTTIRLTSVV